MQILEQIEMGRETEMVREMREKEISEGRWRYRDKQYRLEINMGKLLLRQYMLAHRCHLHH
jgi:hypothetical protein